MTDKIDVEMSEFRSRMVPIRLHFATPEGAVIRSVDLFYLPGRHDASTFSQDVIDALVNLFELEE